MNILIAVDASAASRAAISEVLARPWRADTSFEVISVIDTPFIWAASETAQQAVDGAKAAAEDAVERLLKHSLPASGAAHSGNARVAILDRAKDSHADFIFVGAHNRSGVERALLGSVAGAVARYALCSVGVMRLLPRVEAAPFKILLATDGSDSSATAASSIAARSWPSGTEVPVFSAVELNLPPPIGLFSAPFIGSSTIDAARNTGMKRAQEAIRESRETLQSTSLNVSESVSVALEFPKDSILAEARQWGADLIIMGSHGHGGVERFLLGSVSESVAAGAHCSVELIRKKRGNETHQ